MKREESVRSCAAHKFVMLGDVKFAVAVRSDRGAALVDHLHVLLCAPHELLELLAQVGHLARLAELVELLE